VPAITLVGSYPRHMSKFKNQKLYKKQPNSEQEVQECDATKVEVKDERWVPNNLPLFAGKSN
jgi:hypothetical protein